VLVPTKLPDLLIEEVHLLQIVDTAGRTGQGLAACVVARLTDGRVKIVSSIMGRTPETVLDGLTRRFGPVEAAYAVEPHTGSAGQTRARDLIRHRSWVQCINGWKPSSAPDQARRASGLSRNAAIFAGSLGIRIGALPKVEVIESPPGVFS
jgi:hypothetical protein